MITETFSTVRRTLFLDDAVFSEIKESKDKVKTVFFLIVLVTLVAGAFSFVGKVGMYYTSPTFEDIEGIWKEPMREMQKGAPWFEEVPAEGRANWDDMYDFFWGVAGSLVTMFTPTPVSAFVGIFTGLFFRILFWIILGGIFHICARALSGTGSFDQTLALTGLGASPHILGVVGVIPYARVSVLAWVLVIFVKGIKVAHNFSNRDTILCMLLPFLVIFGLIALIAGVV